MEKKVVVMMAVYNGEKYLAQQIDSILKQDYPELELYIYDDGSTDSSRDILEKFYRKNNNIHLFLGDNVGYPASFYKLTDMKVEADYFMFSDQDDVWLTDKVSRAVNHLEKLKTNLPKVYYSSYNICDGDLNFVRKSPDVHVDFKLKDTLYEVCGLEFTMAMDSNAMQLLSRYKPIKSKARGTWMSMLFSSQGKIVYDNTATANYRRHDSAVTSSNMNRVGMLAWRIKKFLLDDGLLNYRRMLLEFKTIMEPKLTEDEKKLINTFAIINYFPNVFKKVFYPKRLRRNLSDELSLRVMFLINKL